MDSLEAQRAGLDRGDVSARELVERALIRAEGIGSEINAVVGVRAEAALVEARLDAHAERRPLRAADLQRAVEATVPLCRTRSESIAALRSWAADRARPA